MEGEGIPDMTDNKDEEIRILLFAFLIFIHPCKIIIPNIKKIIGKKYLSTSYKRLIIRRPMQQIWIILFPAKNVSYATKQKILLNELYDKAILP